MNDHWVNSKEILLKTNISRATLNNYIKTGILPKPHIRKIEGGQKGPRQIGYFPVSVLDRITTVNLLKSEGRSMEEIALKFKEIPSKETSLHKPETSPEMDPRGKTPAPDDPVTYNVQKGSDDPVLRLTIEDLHSPAYLINYNFEVEWTNREAEEQIFKTPVRSISRLEQRNIFKLFFGWEFHHCFKNWKEIIDFHMQNFKPTLQRDSIPSLYEGISSGEISLLEETYDMAVPMAEKNINKTPMTFSTSNDKAEYYYIYTLFFREGIFFLYLSADRESQEVMKLLATRGKLINDLIKRQLPSLVSLCVLVADLQDSVKISSELMPGEYFQLINDLWKTLAGTFERYNAICGKHAGDGMLHYFIKKPDSNYLMNAIHCALELREKTKVFSKEMKLKKGWFNDLFLNIGINEGQEFFGTIRSASNIEFTALGDSINYAGRLSDFARFGKIWTTKNVIIKLTEEDLSSLCFGVYRKEADHERFVENSFLRVIDLLDSTLNEGNKFADIATLPITEIVGIQDIAKPLEPLSEHDVI